MHVEHLDWLAKNPRYTQRFALQVGKLCRDMPNKAVAEMERLHHSTVKDLDKLYMQQQVDLAGLPAPRAIGIDEISIRKGHNYRVIVSDLDRDRPIWVGGEGRKEADIDLFFEALGDKRAPASNWLPWTCGSHSGTRYRKRPECPDHLRQVSHHAPSLKGPR